MKESEIKFYHGKNYLKNEEGKTHIEEKKEDFKDVETSWESIKLLIYTSTLTIGVDCSKKHFDTFINVF